MNDNILYHGYDFTHTAPPDAEQDYSCYPPRIRDAAEEAHARREVMLDYIRHTKNNGHCDYDSLAALVTDAADAEDNLLQLIRVWQSDALMERTSAPMWMDKLEDPTWDEVK